MPTVSAFFNSFLPSRDTLVRKHSKSEFGTTRNKMMHSMPAGSSGFSMSMLLSGYVSSDFVPTSRIMHEQVTESGKTALVKGLEFSANGQVIATAHSDQCVRFWDSDSLLEKYTMHCSSNVSTMVFSKRRDLMVTCDNFNSMNVIKLWPPRKVNEHSHSQSIHGASFAKMSDQVATASNVIKIWDLGTFNKPAT